MKDSSNVTASSAVANDDEESDVQNLKLKYLNFSSPGRKKSSGHSSDEETSSSSLLPIPDTLKHMRSELKRVIDDAEKPAKISKGHTSKIVVEDMADSLQELRRKYSIKNEASVAMKMNSANLMLDDMLSENNLNDGPVIANFQQKLFQQSAEIREKNVQESDDCSTTESVLSTKYCNHQRTLLSSTADHENHQNVFKIPNDSPCHCCKIPKKVYRPVCTCNNNFYEKGLQVQVVGNDSEVKSKKLKIIEKLQNLHLRCRIQSVCKIVQKNNPFSIRKDRIDDSSVKEQEISHSSGRDSEVEAQDFNNRKSGHQKCRNCPYPRRMVFDLVESSDVSLLDERSESKEDVNCSCPLEVKCTCQSQKDCTCPKLMPVQCTCYDSPKFSFADSECCSCCLKNPPSNSKTRLKVNEFVQTDSGRGSMHALKKENKVEISKAAESLNFKTGNHAVSDSVAHLSSQSKTLENSNYNPSRQVKKQFQKEISTDYHNWKRHCFKERKLVERTDIYYFDHGNSSYYRTTDNHPVRFTECLVERTDEYATKFWGEIFGVIEVGVAFVISFILQLYRFFFTSIIRSLTVGLLQIFSDYFFKPLLTITFNSIVQPCLILAYNIATSVRDLCFPISQIFGFFMKEVANLLKSCRLIDINRNYDRLPACHCGNKV